MCPDQRVQQPSSSTAAQQVLLKDPVKNMQIAYLYQGSAENM